MRVVEGVVRDCVRDVVRTTIKGYCDEFQTVYDSMTTPPDADVAAAQNTMVQSLVDGGVWDKLDVFYLFAQSTNGDGEALKNWISPGTYDATAVNAPTFTAFEGFTGDGSTSYIHTNYNPGDGGTYKYTRLSASFGAYVRQMCSAGEYSLWGSGASPNFNQRAIPNRGSASRYMMINTNGTNILAFDNTDVGVHVLSRDNHDDFDWYAPNDTYNYLKSSEIVNCGIFIHAESNSGSPQYFSDGQISAAFGGSALSSEDVTVITNAIETAMDAMEKGVIP
jgi:hypothetical protein